jgi:cytidylate kinase
MRRYKERAAKGEEAVYDEILSSVIERDRIDSTRETAPLVQPEGAYLVDTSDMTEEQVVDEIVGITRKVMGARNA